MLRRRSVALVAALLLVGLATSCGDDDGGGGGASSDLSSEEQAFVDEALEGFDAEEAAPLTEDDARCIATTMVEEVGVDRLEEMGLTPESFTSDESLPDGLERADAQDLVDGMSECIDMAELLLEGIEDDESLSDVARECLAERFDDGFLEEVMVVLLSEGGAGLSDESGPGAAMLSAYTECTAE